MAPAGVAPAPLLQKQIERLNQLPRSKQTVALKMLEGGLQLD
jgi:hypothetical protein